MFITGGLDTVQSIHSRSGLYYFAPQEMANLDIYTKLIAMCTTTSPLTLSTLSELQMFMFAKFKVSPQLYCVEDYGNRFAATWIVPRCLIHHFLNGIYGGAHSYHDNGNDYHDNHCHGEDDGGGASGGGGADGGGGDHNDSNEVNYLQLQFGTLACY